jgi:hypothetical protein
VYIYLAIDVNLASDVYLESNVYLESTYLESDVYRSVAVVHSCVGYYRQTTCAVMLLITEEL